MLLMAVMHRATLNPTKRELIAGWLPGRPWYPGPAEPAPRPIVSYRFDDPAGEVGIETILVDTGDGTLVQVPMTYRGAPLDGADRWLIGTSEHSVLGDRWIYDACGDPVYAEALANAIRTRTGQAEEFVDVDGRLERRDPSMSVRGSGAHTAVSIAAVIRVDEGDPTVIVTGSVELVVARVLVGAAGGHALELIGTWEGQTDPRLLAWIA